MDTQLNSCSSCTCVNNKMHFTQERKRTDASFLCSDCYCSMNSVKHKNLDTKRHNDTTCYKTNVGYQSQHKDKFIYLYSLLCILCMITSSVSMESIVIEDQLTQVGHFFFYNILTGDSPLENLYQLKVCRHLCICTFMLSICLCICCI